MDAVPLLDLASVQVWKSPTMVLVNAKRFQSQQPLAQVLAQCGHRFGAAFSFSPDATPGKSLSYTLQGACCVRWITSRHLRDVLRFQQWADEGRSPVLPALHTLVVIDGLYLSGELTTVLQEIRSHPHITCVCLFRHAADIPQQLLNAEIIVAGTGPYLGDRSFGHWESPAAYKAALQLFHVHGAFLVYTPRGLHQLPVGVQAEGDTFKRLLPCLTTQLSDEQGVLFMTNNHAVHQYEYTRQKNLAFAGRAWQKPLPEPTLLHSEQVVWLHQSGRWPPHQVATTQQQIAWIDACDVRKGAICDLLLALDDADGRPLLPLVLAQLISTY
jgi:hypothetical protein